SSRRRHTRSTRDWSSDVCSSDLSCDCLICKAQVFRFAPCSGAHPAFQARPISYARVCVCNCDGGGWRTKFVRGQLIDPLYNVAGESVFVHPVHKRREVRRIAHSERLHSFQQETKLLLIELS